MAQTTSIEWTDLSWNPTHGCSKVSPGCAHCYAETLSLRYGQTTRPWSPSNAGENVILKPHKLKEPLSGAKAWQGVGAAAAAAGKTDGKLVFVNSMSDLFHEQIDDDYIAQVFAVMATARRHTFQVLTKRPERMRGVVRDPAFKMEVATLCGQLGREDRDEAFWPLPNVWLGTSIENRRFVNRADYLRDTPAAVRFISAEPLLGPLVYSESRSYPAPDRPEYRGWTWKDALDLSGIDWLIVGGESGPGHRPMKQEWVAGLCDACRFYRLGCEDLEGPRPAFFFKQWGGARPGGDALLDGREWREFPVVPR